MKRQLVSFDWALKKLLRSKANFGILEGFLSELLKDDIKIQSILESETNKKHDADKSSRVDLLVENHKKELIIVEIQYEYQSSYFQRILYGTSKIITDNIYEGMDYGKITKVISVSIAYFDLGQGEDYVYKGMTNFVGLHKQDELKLNETQKRLYGVDKIHKIYPEYYILKINQFNDVAKDGLDEWIYFLKNEKIEKRFKAKGLKEAVNKLDIMKLPKKEQKAYEKYFEYLMDQASWYESSYVRGKLEGNLEGKTTGLAEGKAEGKAAGLAEGKAAGLAEGKAAGLAEGKAAGLAEGMSEGRQEGKREAMFEIVRNMKKQGIAIEIIAKTAGLSIKEINKL